MADVTQTAANVRAKSGATLANKTAGETITPGMLLYESSSKVYKASTSAAANAATIGMAVSYADADEIVVVQTAGDVDPGATATQGETYVVTDTAGNLGIIGDRGSGDYISVFGVGKSDGNIQIGIKNSGIAKA